MNTLIRKELRENSKLAVPAFLVLGLVLWRLYQKCPTQPLLARPILQWTQLSCALFGVVLGWFQIHNERPRDLWAFLVHRPLTRTKIFLAKAAAGLGLYCLAMGLPVGSLVVGAACPGQYAAPFEWGMALPVLGSFLMGMLWYFAGLLAGVRQARWYASRGLVLLAALFIGILAEAEPSWFPGFSQEFLVLAAGLALLAIAAWASFCADGIDAAVPAWGRLALATTLLTGVSFIGLLSQGLFESLILRRHSSDSAYHEITREGTICQVSLRTGQRPRIVELSGAPFQTPGTGLKPGLAEFDKLVAESATLNVDFHDQSEVRNHFRSETRFFVQLPTVERTAWYWRRDGSLAGYDTVTRGLAGTLVPNNFPAPLDRFLRPQMDSEIEPEENETTQTESSTQILASHMNVYEVDLANGSRRVLFTATPEDPIGGAKRFGTEGVIVASRKNIRLISPDGSLAWALPCQSDYPRSLWVKVSKLKLPGRFAVWLGPYMPANRQNSVAARGYSQVLFVSAEQGPQDKIALKPDSAAKARQSLVWRSFQLSSVLMPPLPIFYKLLGWETIPRDLVIISLAVACVCALVAWWLGHRYQFGLGSQIAWAAFHLTAGLPGFLGFLSVQEWPKREPCPGCGTRRSVVHARCNQCNAGFPPPVKNGTEIFEPLTASSPKVGAF